MDEGGDGGIVEGHGNGSGLALGHFKSKAGAAEGANGQGEGWLAGRGFGQAGGDDFGHAEKCMVLDALGGADDDLARVQMWAETSEGGAEKLRGDNGDHDLSVGHGRVVAGDDDLRGDGKAGKKQRVFAGLCDFAGGLGAVGPEGKLVAAATMERERDGGSPGAGT